MKCQGKFNTTRAFPASPQCSQPARHLLDTFATGAVGVLTLLGWKVIDRLLDQILNARAWRGACFQLAISGFCHPGRFSNN
jgi:hypothetical protein